MQNPPVILQAGCLDGSSPQEVFVVQIQHRVVDIPHPLTIQTIDDSSVLGILVDDVGTGMRVPSLVGTRDGDLMDTIGVVADSRHGGRR